MSIQLVFRRAVQPFILAAACGFMLVATLSCNDDFLNQQPPVVAFHAQDTIALNNLFSGQFEVPMELPGGGNKSWRIFQYPTWIDIEPKQGAFAAGNSSFKLTNHPDQFTMGYGLFFFPLVFDVSDFGQVQYTLLYLNLGDPGMRVSSALNLGKESTGSFYIQNQGNGVILWGITAAPKWLKISQTEGVLENPSTEYISFTIDRTGLAAGDYSGHIQIASNARPGTFSIPVFMTVAPGITPGKINFGTGEFIHADYNKARDELIVLVKNPNRLLFYKNAAAEPEVVDLDRIPKCFTLSEDGNSLAVGFSNAEISVFDTHSRGLQKNYSINTTPVGIEFGENGWIYFTGTLSYQNYLFSLDMATGTVSRGQSAMSGMIPLYKIPGKSVLLSTQPGYSPEGLQFFDISKGIANDTVNQWHLPTQGLWLSEDGARIFTGLKKVYRTPDYVRQQGWTMEEPAGVGELDISGNSPITAIAHHSASRKIYVSTWGGYGSAPATIYLLDHNSYVLQKSFEVNTRPPEGFSMSSWWLKIQFIFPTSDGSQIWLVNRYPAGLYSKPDTWSVDKISLN
ncbi:MAG TPA: hypothetical protein PK167_08495 [Prolixibacteraceae bacterium]|mgnify:CR=1 FL=1|nr:hypothetical protein [Prolixibacteraceae bacterium]